MSQSSQPPAPRFAPWKGIVLLLLALGAVYFAYRLWPEPSEESRGLKLSAAQYEHLYALRNLALGEIEAALSTGDLKHALELLDEIEQILPGDRFVTQNRAITYIEALQTAGKATTPDVTIDGVFEVIEALKKAEPKSAIPYLLAGQVAEKSGDGERMLPEAQKAVELAPNDPIAWYSLAKTAEFLPDDADVVKGAKVALTKALALDPTNSQLLRLQAKSLAESQDPQAIDVLERLRGQTALLELVRRMPDTKEDPEKMIDDAVAAVKREDWSKAMVSSERLGNIIKRQDWVRSDLRRLEPNPLAHVALDFSTRIASAGHSKSHESQPISFRAMEGLAAFTSATDVKDLKLADANDDGQLDLVLLSANGLRVLARQGAEWKPLLEYVAEGPFNQVLVADLDRDETNTEKKPIPQGEQTPLADPRVCDTADIDFVLAGPGGVVILRNELVTQGTGRHLVAVEQLEAFSAQRDIRTATLVDFDQDGDLDLVLALESGVRFWRNRGDLTMEDVTRRSQALPENVKITSFFPAPWNYDCFIDIVATTAAGRVGFYENLGHSTFRWQEMTGRFAEFSGMSEVAVIDADGNADWDLVGVGKAGVGLALSRAADVGTIAAIDVRSLSSTGGNRFLTVDFNNDSWFDLLTWTKAGDGRPQILLGGPKGVFSTEPSSSVGLPGGPVFALAAGDLDHDGDWDLAVAGPEGVKFFANEGAGKNHWTEVRLRAQPADDVARVNHLGLGSTLEMWRGRDVRRQIVTGQFTHFGLGEIEKPDMLRTIWTNCIPQPRIDRLEPDIAVCEVQVQSTSCPFLFTWNGEQFEFLYDFLWGAPLGLQFAEGVFAPSRPWEYLHIPGERMKSRDGKLVLQMTEELQEATYIDHMRLLAIDHPADVEVFSNEKVGPPEISEYQIHTVRRRRAPVAARDKHGRDVLDEIALADLRFFRGFDSTPRTGRVDSHYLELDLGDLGPYEQSKKIQLVLSGYIYPVPTSVGVGLAQNAKNPPGSPPALWVPDALGEWREVRPFTGFPGGKNKTVVLDLSDAFLTRDYRLRIATNFEIYWDEAFFTLDESPVEVRQTPVELTRADLHFRGFSERRTSPHNGPDTYIYDVVEKRTVWLPMEGNFTRFGDVRPLLETEDDQLVVFGFGDELTLEFAELPPPPAGWKRDYILHNVGWDKDCDPNVLLSGSVEPLPFRAMTCYPYGPDEEYPETASHRAYLKKYQTRRMDRMAFWRGR